MARDARAEIRTASPVESILVESGSAVGVVLTGGEHWKQAKSAYGERVLEKVESYAPGFRERIIRSAVVAPDDLEAANPNLVGGDSVGGTHHLSQNLLFRSAPGLSNYRAPSSRLMMVGVATWPGAGLNAISGRLAAQELIRGDSVPRKLLKPSGRVRSRRQR